MSELTGLAKGRAWEYRATPGLKGANIAVAAPLSEGWEDRRHGFLVSLPRRACSTRRTPS